jgi:hypothetical protein
MDDSLVTDAAVLAWKQMHTLIENGASDADVDQAMRQYLEACEQQMKAKEKQK